MIELYKAEIGRFARWAAGAVVLHALALLMLDDYFPDTTVEELSMLAGTVYLIGSLIFAFYQAATYARANHWVALLHRPMAPARIMAAITGAGATVAIVVVAVPLLIMTGVHALSVERFVETRHWWFPVGGALLALIGFFSGSYAALAPRRYGWTGLVAAAILMIGNLPSGVAALILPLALVIVLVLLTLGAFRPDRTLPPCAPALRLLTGATATLALYFVLLLAFGMTYQLSLAAAGRNPLINAASARSGGLVQSSRMNGDELIASTLAATPGAEAAALRTRLRGVEVARLPIALDTLPVRGALTSMTPSDLADAKRGIRWVYSDDANAYRGLRIRDQASVGMLRPAGGFSAPPFAVGDGMIASGASLYRLDPQRGTLARLAQLPAGELIAARPARVDGNLALLGTRALHLFDRGGGRATVPLPGLIGDLRRLDVARLPDRLVVSFFFGRDSIEGPMQAWQRIVTVAPDGAVRTVAERRFAPEFGDVLRFRKSWLAPVVDAGAEALERMGGREGPTQARTAIVVPRGVWTLAITLSLLSAAATALLARRRRLGAPLSTVWTLAALVLGLPALLAFCLVERKQPA